MKNRGKKPSARAGSGIKGIYKGHLFRSTYELSFLIKILEENDISFSYETLKIKLDDGTHYIPDFVCVDTKVIYEIKYEKALIQPKVKKKLEAGQKWCDENGYRFEIYTEKRMRMLTYDEIAQLAKDDVIEIHHRKNAGVRFKQVMKSVEKNR